MSIINVCQKIIIGERSSLVARSGISTGTIGVISDYEIGPFRMLRHQQKILKAIRRVILEPPIVIVTWIVHCFVFSFSQVDEFKSVSKFK